MKACPVCKSEERVRRRRRGLLQYIPNSRAYKCTKCHTRYIWIKSINKSFKIKESAVQSKFS